MSGITHTPWMKSFGVAAPKAAPASYIDSILGTSSTASSTADTTPSLNIGAGQFYTPKLYKNGTLIASTYNSSTGTLTPNAELSDGAYNFTYTLTKGTKESNPSPAIAVTINTTPTTAPSSYIDSVTGLVSTAATTKGILPAIIVGTNLTATPNLYIDGVLVTSTYNSSTGTLTPSNAVSHGSHTFAYSLSRNGVASGVSPAFTISVNLTPATAPSSYIDDATGTSSTSSTTSGAYPAFNIGTNLVSGSTPNLYVDGSIVASSYNSSTGTLTPYYGLENGTHTIAYSITSGGVESAKSPAFTLTVNVLNPSVDTVTASWGTQLTGSKCLSPGTITVNTTDVPNGTAVTLDFIVYNAVERTLTGTVNSNVATISVPVATMDALTYWGEYHVRANVDVSGYSYSANTSRFTVWNKFKNLGDGDESFGYWVTTINGQKIIVSPHSMDIASSWGPSYSATYLKDRNDGLDNCNNIILFYNQFGQHPALQHCINNAIVRQYSGSTLGAYTWYVPAIDELQTVFNASKTYISAANGFGTTTGYYSSTDIANNSNTIAALVPQDGSIGSSQRSAVNRVRPIRREPY